MKPGSCAWPHFGIQLAVVDPVVSVSVSIHCATIDGLISHRQYEYPTFVKHR